MSNSVGTRLFEDIDNTLIKVGCPIDAPIIVDWEAFRKAVDKINKLKEESNENSGD